MFSFASGLLGNEFDRMLKKHARAGSRTFLVVWNRGLGDIALGMFALVHRIRMFIPDAGITFLTRPELEEGFRLLERVDVISAPWWQRGVQTDLAETMERLGISESDFDVVIGNVNPTKWLSWQIGRLQPKLLWREEYDGLSKRFGLDPHKKYVGAHVSSETGRFYKTQKDWPAASWQELFHRLSCETDYRIILFGHRKTGDYGSQRLTDLRGETSLLEMLSIIKGLCPVLIAPDGGVLAFTYYLDTHFPIRVISLWGDAQQGVLKQGVASPNPGLEHIPIRGRYNNVANITIEEVFSKL